MFKASISISGFTALAVEVGLAAGSQWLSMWKFIVNDNHEMIDDKHRIKQFYVIANLTWSQYRTILPFLTYRTSLSSGI